MATTFGEASADDLGAVLKLMADDVLGATRELVDSHHGLKLWHPDRQG